MDTFFERGIDVGLFTLLFSVLTCPQLVVGSFYIRNHDMSTYTRKHGLSVWGYLLTLFLFQITAPIRRAEGQQNTNEVSGIVNLYTLVIRYCDYLGTNRKDIIFIRQ